MADKQSAAPSQAKGQGPPPEKSNAQPKSAKRPEGSGNPDFTVIELIDLALCSPEVGAVNFNILRILLRDIVSKTGIEASPVKVNDLEAHQVENFKNYVQGSAVASPMPGVLRIGPGGSSSKHKLQTPRTPKTGAPPPPTPLGTFAIDSKLDLSEKVARLEKHLEALYQLPANSELIEKAKIDGGMSVNDMWQIIQLNNRIAAAEAAIQKMASLIEDLAKNMGRVKSDTKNIKKDTDEITQKNSSLQLQGDDLSEKCDQCADVVRGVKGDLENLKKAWRADRDNLEKTLGVDLGNIPTFMKPKQKKAEKDAGTGSAGVDLAPGESPSEQFERGTQTFVKIDKDKDKDGKKEQPPPRPKKAPEKMIPPEAIAKMTPEEIAKEITPEEIRKIPPEVYRDMTPEQKKAIQEIRKMSKPPQQEGRKPPLGISSMSKSEISELKPEKIAEKMPYEEAINIPPEVLEQMTDEQRATVKKVIDKGPTSKRPTSRKDLRAQKSQEKVSQKQKPPPPPMGVASMDADEVKGIPPAEIVASMPYEEAANIPPEVLAKMTSEQKAAVKKVLSQGPRKKEPSQDAKKEPPKALGVAAMTQEELQGVQASEIAAKMTYEEAKGVPQEVWNKMTSDQQAAIRKVVNAGPPKDKPKQGKEKQMGINTVTADKLQEIAPEDIATQMGYEEAKTIPPKTLEKMTHEQRQAVKRIIDSGPKGGKPGMNVGLMTKDQLTEVEPDQILADMKFKEAKNIPPKVLEKMTDEQKAAVQQILDTGPPPEEEDVDSEYDPEVVEEELGEEALASAPQSKPKGTDTGKGQGRNEKRRMTIQEVQQLAQLTPSEIIQNVSPTEAANIPDDILKRRFTPEQVKELQKLKEEATGINVDKVADMTPEELVASLTPQQILNIRDDQLKQLDPEQRAAVLEARKSLEKEQTDSGLPDEENYDTMEDIDSAVTGSSRRKSVKERGKLPKRDAKSKHHHHHRHHKKDEEGEDGKHAKIDVVQGPIPTVGESLPPITLEEYLANLPPEEAANLAADAVQRELQKQYQQLQGMQRQLAQDIQEKMEFIYQKLLREIVSQQLTTSPYMAVGGPEQCLGPGICTGHGMPAGIAVVQFPEAKDKQMVPVGADGTEVKVCPGPPICPGKDICPHCRAGKDGLQALKGIDAKKPGGAGALAAAAPLAIKDGRRISELDEALLEEMKSLMMLDLEKIRDEMRSKKMGTYDEQDILERLGAVWEALKILKHNEEAIAVKIAKQDAVFKRLPTKTIEKLSKIPDENLDAITTGNFNKPMYIPEDHARKQSFHKEAEEIFHTSVPYMPPTTGGGGTADKEDIQTLFNNLANVIAECTEQKDRIDQLSDTARILESGMVTKQMLLDALSDKADKGLINTKVSYDEFGNTIDELHTQLHNLMVEGYQRNENWKKVNADLAEELAEKLDKVELAPIRAFFKSHLKALEDKVKNLTQLIEEPDPAGTRKKLLRDYNCISCDRGVNISGVTNGPTLPTIGPINAGHSTASKRALDLHRMRMLKQFDPNTKNLNALEKHGKDLKKSQMTPQQFANDMDVMHVVNRYTGGSHTSITNANRLAAQKGLGSKTGSGNAIEMLLDSTNRHHSDSNAPEATAPGNDVPAAAVPAEGTGRGGGSGRNSLNGNNNLPPPRTSFAGGDPNGRKSVGQGQGAPTEGTPTAGDPTGSGRNSMGETGGANAGRNSMGAGAAAGSPKTSIGGADPSGRNSVENGNAVGGRGSAAGEGGVANAPRTSAGGGGAADGNTEEPVEN